MTGSTATRTTGGGSSTIPIDNPDQRIQQDIDIFTTGTGPETNTPTVGTSQTLVFGTVFAIVNVVVVHPDPVGPRRPADDLRCHRAEGAVLDGAAVRVLHDGRRVLDRPPADPAVLPQRAHQRRVPLCAGAAARRGRGRRLLPRRTRRTRPADDEIHGNHHQLPGLRPAEHRIPRLEQVDEPDRQPAADGRAGAPVVRTARSSSATSRNRRARSSTCTTRCRSSARSTTRSPATGRPSSASTGCSPPTKQQGRYRH